MHDACLPPYPPPCHPLPCLVPVLARERRRGVVRRREERRLAEQVRLDLLRAAVEWSVCVGGRRLGPSVYEGVAVYGGVAGGMECVCGG